MSTHHYVSPIKPGSGYQKIDLGDGSTLIGKVSGSTFVVSDTIDERGNSELAITNDPPTLHPIPMDYLEKLVPGLKLEDY